MERQLVDEYYHHSIVFFAFIFLNTLAAMVLAVLLTGLIPITNIPHIGTYYQMLFELFTKTDTLEGRIAGELLLVIINAYLYWCLLLVALYSVINWFFKELKGYRSGWYNAIYSTLKKAARYGLFSVGAIIFIIVSLKYSLPLSVWYIELLETDQNMYMLSLMLPIVFTVAMYGMGKMFIKIIMKKYKSV